MQAYTVYTKRSFFPFHPMDMFSSPKANIFFDFKLVFLGKDGSEIPANHGVTAPFSRFRLGILLIQEVSAGRSGTFIRELYKFKMRSDQARFAQFKGVRLYRCDPECVTLEEYVP